MGRTRTRGGTPVPPAPPIPGACLRVLCDPAAAHRNYTEGSDGTREIPSLRIRRRPGSSPVAPSRLDRRQGALFDASAKTGSFRLRRPDAADRVSAAPPELVPRLDETRRALHLHQKISKYSAISHALRSSACAWIST